MTTLKIIYEETVLASDPKVAHGIRNRGGYAGEKEGSKKNISAP